MQVSGHSGDPIAFDDLLNQLQDLGLAAGGILLVHASFSKIGPVEGGPRGLIAALQAVLGPDGTLVMPSMSDDDEQPFDAATSACVGMGVVADTFWRLPGVLRSDNPHAFAAAGPRASSVTSPHPLAVPHGLDSPAGRVYSLDGQVLLLGVGHDANTTIHVAENLAGVRYRLPAHVTVLDAAGRPGRYDYAEVDHCCANFALLDDWLADRQRRGPVGHGPARLVRSRDVVEVATARLLADETAFLHPPGVDAECDAARASLAGPGPC